MAIPRGSIRTFATAVAALAVVLPAAPQAAEHRYIDPSGEILPLSEGEVLEFLRTAEVVETQRIGIGINGIDRLILEKDGLRLRAGFREVDLREQSARVGGVTYREFRDSYLFEPAAYKLARALGIESVPPTVLRRIRQVDGSLQLWMEETFEDNNEAQPANAMEWARQLWNMTFFDGLVCNVDRNPGNILIDRRFRLWMIDHTRAFQLRADPFELERIGHVGRDVWERLQALQRSDYDEMFSGLLEPVQVGFFMRRRDALVDHINTLIAERSEAAVLF